LDSSPVPKAQALVGWIQSPRAPDGDQEWYDFGLTLEYIFASWMNGATLSSTLAYASTPNPPGSGITLAFPFGMKNTYSNGGLYYKSDNLFYYRIYGYPDITRTGYR